MFWSRLETMHTSAGSGGKRLALCERFGPGWRLAVHIHTVELYPEGHCCTHTDVYLTWPSPATMAPMR